MKQVLPRRRIQIKRISPGSLSLTLAIAYGLVGFCFAILALLGALTSFGIGDFSAKSTVDLLPMLILQPLISALAGAVTGMIVAWVYNAIARYTKGILIEYSEAGRHDD